MSQVAEVLKAILSALAAVFLIWHLLGLSKRLAGGGRGSPSGRQRQTKRNGDSFRNEPINPR
jgi:hypothetical protein